MAPRSEEDNDSTTSWIAYLSDSSRDFATLYVFLPGHVAAHPLKFSGVDWINLDDLRAFIVNEKSASIIALQPPVPVASFPHFSSTATTAPVKTEPSSQLPILLPKIEPKTDSLVPSSFYDVKTRSVLVNNQEFLEILLSEDEAQIELEAESNSSRTIPNLVGANDGAFAREEASSSVLGHGDPKQNTSSLLPVEPFNKGDYISGLTEPIDSNNAVNPAHFVNYSDTVWTDSQDNLRSCIV
ncbi:hypothetical protein C8J56DRAFT_1037674 [Mycena floridula]|nr:hypothetical protein C8J56DRAFT_1037674 [Mycena floridula]